MAIDEMNYSKQITDRNALTYNSGRKMMTSVPSCSWLTTALILTFGLMMMTNGIDGYPKTALRQEELTNDILCATHAYDATPCHHLVGEKWGKKQDRRAVCCYFVDVQLCILRRREEYCSGDFLEAFRQEYKRSVTHWKSTKCKDYFVNSDCEEHLEIWSMAVMVMLCLISSMACITLVILYTKK